MPRLFFLFLAIVIPLASGAFAGMAANPARVMIVHSYERNHICGAPQAYGIVAALSEAGWIDGKNLQIQSYHMDSKKTHTTPEAIRQQASIALRQVEEFAPNVVMVLDDNAIREVMLPLVGRKDLSVVFSGMNGQPEDYNEKAPFMRSKRRPGSSEVASPKAPVSGSSRPDPVGSWRGTKAIRFPLLCVGG